MKYKATNENPFIKEGVIIDHDNINNGIYGWSHKIDVADITSWISNEWIEEIQEKEFTKDEMIKFAKFYENGVYNEKRALDLWLYNRNLENKPFEK